MSIEAALLEHTAALNNLAEAIRANGGIVNSAPAASGATSTKSGDDKPNAGADEGAAFWHNPKKGTFGEVANKGEIAKLKKGDKDLIAITETKYKALVKAAEEAKNAKSDDDAPVLTKAEITKIAQSFLPRDLSDDDKAERLSFVKALLARFGGAKITEMPEEHFGLAGNLLQRKLAGQEVDPETDGYEEIEEGEDDLV